MRFPGQYFDAETGLYYNTFRTYHPALGRYLESDPIGLAGGLNTYAYVGGNPVMRVDPRGLESWSGDDEWNFLTDSNRYDVYLCVLSTKKITYNYFGTTGYNDEADAFKHCLLSCCLTAKLGVLKAQKWTDGHENIPGNPACERTMDQHNNFAGRTVALSSGKSCVQGCLNTPLAVVRSVYCPDGCSMRYFIAANEGYGAPRYQQPGIR